MPHLTAGFGPQAISRRNRSPTRFEENRHVRGDDGSIVVVGVRSKA